MKKIHLFILLFQGFYLQSQDISTTFNGITCKFSKITSINTIKVIELKIQNNSGKAIYIDTNRLTKVSNDSFITIGVGCFSNGFPYALQSHTKVFMTRIEPGNNIIYKIELDENIQKIHFLFDCITFKERQKDLFYGKHQSIVDGAFLFKNMSKYTLLNIDQQFSW